MHSDMLESRILIRKSKSLKRMKPLSHVVHLQVATRLRTVPGALSHYFRKAFSCTRGYAQDTSFLRLLGDEAYKNIS